MTVFVLAGLAVLAGLTGLVRGCVAIVTVSGESMRPAYRHGDRVLVRRAGPTRLRRGQVVLVERPGARGTWASPPPRWPGGSREWMIKRVAALPGDSLPGGSLGSLGGDSLGGDSLGGGSVVPAGMLFVLGDNPAVSIDSRQLGCWPTDRLLGVVLRSG